MTRHRSDFVAVNSVALVVGHWTLLAVVGRHQGRHWMFAPWFSLSPVRRAAAKFYGLLCIHVFVMIVYKRRKRKTIKYNELEEIQPLLCPAAFCLLFIVFEHFSCMVGSVFIFLASLD